MICAITCNDALPLPHHRVHPPVTLTAAPSRTVAPRTSRSRSRAIHVCGFQGRDNGRSLSARYWPIVASEREPERPYRVRRGVIPGTPQGDSSFFDAGAGRGCTPRTVFRAKEDSAGAPTDKRRGVAVSRASAPLRLRRRCTRRGRADVAIQHRFVARIASPRWRVFLGIN